GPYADATAELTVHVCEEAYELGYEALRAPRRDALLRDRLDTLDGQVVHPQVGVEAEIREDQKLGCSVPAFGVVARVSFGEPACLCASQSFVEAEPLAHHRVQQVVGGRVENPLDFEHLAAFQTMVEEVDRWQRGGGSTADFQHRPRGTCEGPQFWSAVDQRALRYDDGVAPGREGGANVREARPAGAEIARAGLDENVGAARLDEFRTRQPFLKRVQSLRFETACIGQPGS